MSDLDPHLIALELVAHPPMEVVYRPQTVLELAGLLQLALRHPRLADASCRDTAEKLLHAIRDYFDDCPVTLELLRRGDDPRYDVT